MLLAEGKDKRLGILTGDTAKPALPFGEKYRIIDFTPINCLFRRALEKSYRNSSSRGILEGLLSLGLEFFCVDGIEFYGQGSFLEGTYCCLGIRQADNNSRWRFEV